MTSKRFDRIALRAVVGLVAVVLLVGFACATREERVTVPAGTPPAPGPASGIDSVIIESLKFDPAQIQVEVGKSILWTNEDSTGHTVTSGTPGQPTGVFDHSLPGKGSTANVAFPNEGTFPYFCKIHNQMTGQVTVFKP